MAKSPRTIVQLVLLGLLLIVAPAGSYLYLKWGYNYRVESLSELQEFGNLRTAAAYTEQTRRTVDVVLLTPNEQDSTAIAVRQLHEAFVKQPLVQFVGFGESPTSALPRGNTVATIPLTAQVRKSFADLSSRDPHCEAVPLNRRALVVDTSGLVRRCYDLRRGQEVNRIVEQLNILVPRPEKEDIFVSQQRDY